MNVLQKSIALPLASGTLIKEATSAVRLTTENEGVVAGSPKGRWVFSKNISDRVPANKRHRAYHDPELTVRCEKDWQAEASKNGLSKLEVFAVCENAINEIVEQKTQGKDSYRRSQIAGLQIFESTCALQRLLRQRQGSLCSCQLNAKNRNTKDASPTLFYSRQLYSCMNLSYWVTLVIDMFVYRV